MTISDNLNRIINAKANIKQAIENKGVEVSDNALLDEYPALIDSIEVGSGEGGADPYYEHLFNVITNNNTNYQYLFHGYNGTELDVNNLDTSNVINMEYTFNNCNELTSLDVSNWNTSNVKYYMSYMFANCSSLISLDLSNFDTSNVTSMYNMFAHCYNLTTLYVSNFDTSNVIDMGYMFYNCKLLTSLDISNFNTSKVTSSMQSMFNGCQSLTELDLSNFDTNNVTSMGYMFEGCESLITLDLSNWDMTKCTSSSSTRDVFNGCTSLHTLRLDNCSNATISKIINSRNFPTKAIDGVTRTIYCKEENIGDLVAPTNWVFSFVTEEEPEVPVDPPAGDIPLYEHGQFYGNSELTEVRTMVTSEHDNLDSMFAMCENLVSVNTQDWDTSNVYEMYYMFANCKSLTTLNLSNWVTDKVTRMAEMFMLCWNLTELDLSNFNTSNVTNVSWMFYNCQRLESLDLSNFNLENLTGDDNNPMGTENMFNSCYALTTLRLDNCSYDTITKIINSHGFPVSNQGNIYCKAENAANLTLPEGFNWTFNYIE